MLRIEQLLPATVTSVLRRGSVATLFAEIAGSNSAGGCTSLVSVECCQRSVRLAEHSFRGVLLIVSLSVIVKHR